MSKDGSILTNCRKSIQSLQKTAIDRGLHIESLRWLFYNDFHLKKAQPGSTRKIFVSVIAVSVLSTLILNLISIILSTRCLLFGNYLVWEATRPLSDCEYCRNVTKPIILKSISREEFAIHAYSSKPIIVKNAVNHWRARKEFSFSMFKRLYMETKGSYYVSDEDCQFLNFKSDLFSLRDVFSMPDGRANNKPGHKPWYVGWSNCHPDVHSILRQYYDVPHFLPADAEYPITENIFFGYEIGAVMHVTIFILIFICAARFIFCYIK